VIYYINNNSLKLIQKKKIKKNIEFDDGSE
jgi:hypothetical protein